MAMQPINNAVSAEQLMLTKMQNMQQQVQPDFLVANNPMDVNKVNPPMAFSGAMKNVLDMVNQHQSTASQKMTAVETGQSDDLVGADDCQSESQLVVLGADAGA